MDKTMPRPGGEGGNDGPIEYADGAASLNGVVTDEADDQLLEMTPHISTTPARLNRRNSISLPAGLDLEHLSLAQEMPRREDDSDSSEQYSAGSSEEEERLKVPLRARKKSVMPQIKINDDDLLDAGDTSPHNSVTSVNSIASLLKEKMAMSLPAMLKNKRPQEYKLKAFVAILFMCIVFLVGFAHVYYHQQVLQRAYFENIRINKEERRVRVFDVDKVELLHGNIGTFLGGHHVVYDCLPRDALQDGSVCMEWMHLARLHLRYTEHRAGADPVRCYTVTWTSLQSYVQPMDCYDWAEGNGHWYGGGQTANMVWPLDEGVVEMSPFITGDVRRQQWGGVLSRYFISSKGVAISVDAATPLHVSINANNSSRFCMKAEYDDFAYVNHPHPLPKLNYSICTSKNMSHLHEFLSEKNLWDGLKKEDFDVVNTFMSEPVWQIAPDTRDELTEAAIYNYTEDVIALGFLRQGHVLLNEYWQTNIGDFSLDTTRFPTLEETVNIIHRRGFRIIFPVQPYISTDSGNFNLAVRDGMLVQERGSQHSVPALVQYKSMLSGGVLDVTKNSTAKWLAAKIKSLIELYNIDSLFVDVGTAYDLPHYYRLDSELLNPDHYKKHFVDAVVQAAGAAQKSVVAVSSAISRPRATTFVALPPFASSWESMKTIIPTILTYGVAGYPLILPGPVGGDFQANATARLPEKELYLRWLQLATFLPVIRYTHLPSKYADDKLLETAKFLTALRLKTVNPLLKKYVREALDSGLPIIRPLWMLDPADHACAKVSDEFSVGGELLVAPIIQQGATSREVYLPSGVWKDGIDGSLRKGSRWLHSYKVPLDKVAHFIKMPDNTRF